MLYLATSEGMEDQEADGGGLGEAAESAFRTGL